MSRRLTNFTLLLIWLLAGCDSGGFAPRGPITLAFTVQPASAVASAAISPVVITVQDAHGNTLSSASTSIAMEIGSNPASGTLAGQTTVAAVQGVATFSNLSIDKSGSGYTLTAHANGATGATSSSFDVTPAPKKLAFSVQPKPSQVGHAISPAVEVAVQDQQGETVAGASTTVTILIATGGGRLSGTVTVSAVNGVATFPDLTIDTPGHGYTLLAYGDGFEAISDPFTIWVPFVISGAVTGAIADGVLITLSGAMSGTTTTAGGGLYSFFGLANGNYILTPSKAGYRFSPASIAVTVSGGNVTGQNFTAPVAYSISGAVSGAIADGVLITLSGAMSDATSTAGGGLYSFFGLANGNYILTPSKAGYRFSPASIAVRVNGVVPGGGNVTGQNFTAAVTYSISGTVSGTIADGVLITLNGAASACPGPGCPSPATAFTAGGGLYSFTGASNGNYTLTPSKPGYSFNPTSIAVTVSGGDVTGRNFMSTACSAGNWRPRNPLQGQGSLYGVWGSGTSDVWAVGSGGIVHWDGSAWTAVLSGIGPSGIWGSGASDVWAVGGSGIILHWDGSAWASVPSCTTGYLFGVWGSGASDVWAVGESGTMLERGP